MYKQKIILFFSIISFLFLIFMFITFFVCIKHPRYIPAQYVSAQAVVIKEHYAQTITKPKILIVSGSNALLGICTPLLKEKTNKEIVNFGLNLSLPLEFYLGLTKKNAKPNDIVIMPLEYQFYTKGKKLNNQIIQDITTWGIEYLNEFSPDQILQIFFSSIPTTCQRIKNYNIKFPIITYNNYYNAYLKSTAILASQMHYIYNRFGDFLVDNSSKLKNNFKETYFNISDLKDFRFKQLKDFSDYLAKQNIKLIFTYPVSIQNPDFDLSKTEHLNKIIALNQKFKEYELNVIGMPELSNIDFVYSLDTLYHLNAEGAMLRTLYLADTINCYLAGIPQEIPNLEKYKREKRKEAKVILNKYRKLGYYNN